MCVLQIEESSGFRRVAVLVCVFPPPCSQKGSFRPEIHFLENRIWLRGEAMILRPEGNLRVDTEIRV